MKNSKTNLAGILNHREKRHNLTDLAAANPKLTQLESLIVKCRTNGVSFCQLDETDVRIFNDRVILHCAAVTGFTLPYTDGFADIICENLTEMIGTMGYGELTFEEVKLAFRLNYHTHLKFPALEITKVPVPYGVCFHVGFVMDVLFNYMILRNFIDRKFQNQIDGY